MCHPDEISVSMEDGVVTVTRPSDQPQHRALHGLTRMLVANMVEGVMTGFKKTLEIQGVGYRALQKGLGHRVALGLFAHDPISGSGRGEPGASGPDHDRRRQGWTSKRSARRRRRFAPSVHPSRIRARDSVPGRTRAA